MPDDRNNSAKLLAEIENHVRDTSQLATNNGDCMEILKKVQLMKLALSGFEDAILKEHAARCIADAIAAGDARKTQKLFDGLVAQLTK
jgi:DNA-binding FrmR family transcriptional regulator